MVAGALALAARTGRSGAGRASPRLAPADRTLAWASPAVFGKTPRRRFYAGADPNQAVTVEDLRAMAHRRLPGFVLEYLEAGGEDEAALARNIAALAEWRFVHRSMVDVSRRDTCTTLFDRRLAIPVVVAPTGLNGLFWPHADLRLAEAAAEAGVPFAQSTMSNDAMSKVACVSGLRYWWQLYVFGPPEVRETLIERAHNAGCEALVVTVDAQIYGNREWHKRTTAGPKSLSWGSRLDALMHPRWLARGIATHGMPRFENVVEFVPKNRRGFFDSAH
jgi:(S)-mandelate dehydrogenase